MDHAPKGGVPLREELGVAARTRLVGCVASLLPYKNPEPFLRVAEPVTAQESNVHFVWVGDGSARTAMMRSVRERGLAGTVHLLGTRPDGPWLPREFDVAVLTSYIEGMPNAVMEYMYWGGPSVVTAVGGAAELLQDGRTGFLVRSDDAAAMSERLLRVVRDNELAASMGTASRERLGREFSAATMVDRMLAVYDAALAPAFRAPRRVSRRRREDA